MQRVGQDDKRQARTEEPVAALEDVSLRDDHDGHILLDGVSLRLHPGHAVHVAVEDDPRFARRLADVLCGICSPDAGAVQIFGRAWEGCTPREAARMRARIGRVFSGVSWLSNLDMDENVLLAARHHTAHSDVILRERARQWSARFGLDALPEGRPAWIDERTSVLAQWVRAFLLDPDILVLQDPVTGAARDAGSALADALSDAVQRGAAVLWMERASAPSQAEFLPGHPGRFVLRRGRLVAAPVRGASAGGSAS